MSNISLNKLPIGKKAVIQELNLNGFIKHRMIDLGLVKNTNIEALQKSPSGDPTAYFIKGTVIAIREEEASKIFVESEEL